MLLKTLRWKRNLAEPLFQTVSPTRLSWGTHFRGFVGGIFGILAVGVAVFGISGALASPVAAGRNGDAISSRVSTSLLDASSGSARMNGVCPVQRISEHAPVGSLRAGGIPQESSEAICHQISVLHFQPLPAADSRASVLLVSQSVSAGSEGLLPGQWGSEGFLEIHAEFTPPTETQPSYLWVTVRIRPGYYIYSITQPRGGPIPTRIRLDESPVCRLADSFQSLVPPQRKQEPLFNNLTVEYHMGEVAWRAPLEWASDADLKNQLLKGRVVAQVCDATTCYPPRDYAFEARLGTGLPFSEAPGLGTVPAVSAAIGAEQTAPAPAAESLSWGAWVAILLSALAGGLILNLMPCVLPVISLKIFALIEQAGQDRWQVFMLNLWYVLGLISVFLVLATLSAFVNLAWGEQFTFTWFKVALTGLVFAMALSFLGVWEIPIPGFAGSGTVGQLQSREGALGAFFKGVFTTILATPCTGPFLGAVFGFTLDKPPYVAYAVFGTVGLGMALPYLALGAFPELIRFLPRPGKWMETLKELMAFLLLGTVVYLFTTINERYFISTLALLIGLWFGCWLIGRIPLTVSRSLRAAAWGAGILGATAVGVFGFTVLLENPKLQWTPFTPERLDQARAEGYTVMVDFTADWCPNCKWNLAFAIETDRVAELVARNKVLPLLADWTDQSPLIKDFLTQRLRRQSIPVLAIWPAGASDQEAIVLDGTLLESQVIEALKQAGPSKVQPRAGGTTLAQER